jgi:ABC-type uncharacterized transport system substrate-binding protein
MRNKILYPAALCALLFAFCLPAEAQPGKVHRIGFLSGNPARSSSQDLLEEFRQGLRDLGYAEGQNIIIVYRYGEGIEDRLRELAAELVRLKVELIVAVSAQAARAAQRVSTTIPIVMTASGDAVGSALIESLARPGGNITGLTVLDPELSGKRLELLKESVPTVSRVAVLGTPSRGQAIGLRAAGVAASALKIQLQSLEVRAPDPNFDSVFSAIRKERANGLLTLTQPLIALYRKQIVDFTVKSRLPAMFHEREFVEADGLLSYGASRSDLYHRAAVYVDKLLKGAKPADLPVEQPMKFELVINLKTAKQIGLTIPPNVLARADKVIK